MSSCGMNLIVTHRGYRALFCATGFSNLGDGIVALAFPWLATLITRDPMAIALVAMATRLPWTLFAIPAGLLTDRADRRRLILQADLFRVLLCLATVAFVVQLPEGAGAIAALCTLAFLLGCAEVVRDNAAQTLLPSLVPPEQLERANGALWSVEQVMGAFVGPPLAGALIAYAVPAPFAMQALCLALALWCVWLIRMPPRIAPPPQGLRAAFVEAARWMRDHPMLIRVAVMLGAINALSMMTLTVLVLFSQEILGLNAAQHGVLLTAGAAGGVAGGLLGPRLIARIGGRVAMILSLVLIGLAMGVLGLSGSAWLAGLALFAETVAALLWNIVTVSWRQRLIPDALLGRVNSLYRFFGWGSLPLGALMGGAIVAWFEPGLGREMALRLPFLLGAAGSLLLALYALRKLRL